MGVSQNQGYSLGVPIIRSIIYEGGSPHFGKLPSSAGPPDGRPGPGRLQCTLRHARASLTQSLQRDSWMLLESCHASHAEYACGNTAASPSACTKTVEAVDPRPAHQFCIGHLCCITCWPFILCRPCYGTPNTQHISHIARECPLRFSTPCLKLLTRKDMGPASAH